MYICALYTIKAKTAFYPSRTVCHFAEMVWPPLTVPALHLRCPGALPQPHVPVSTWNTASSIDMCCKIQSENENKHITLLIDKFFVVLETGREGEWKGKKHPCENEKEGPVAFHMRPHRGPSPQPRPVPPLGIEGVTFWFTGQHPTNWASLAGTLIDHFWYWFLKST